PVCAGLPTAIGDLPIEMIMLPKALLSMQPEMMLRVTGDSMIDLQIEEGDLVKMKIDKSPKSGDIAVVVIGNDATLKVFHEDENGIQWLIAQNKAKKHKYKPIMLNGRTEDVIICGVVTDVMRSMPRVPYRIIAEELRAAKAEMEVNMDIPPQRVSSMIQSVAGRITIGRMWYAVYRVMVDLLLVKERDYEGFCNLVETEVPHHKHLPSVKEMQRMAVESFAKPAKKWDEDAAPVKGKRFIEYQKLAEDVEKLLLGVEI
ncbi:MAG: hypothetical protein J6035_03085, partial [Bacteroidaceae bacterium]|nr:hypothetical protein [Bacteroidaceae bacterium]